MKRTHYCGALREEQIDQTITAAGWVQTKRDMGGVIFIDLRDREGTLQVVLDATYLNATDFHLAEHLRNESVIVARGFVRLRDEETYNPKIKTGTIELVAQQLALLSEAETLPFAIEDDTSVREELRLEYRYLDIRRPTMLENLRFRHRVQRVTQNYLDADGFIEVETPMLCKSTPEGARDYLVPSRVHPGSFYALPQSPQIYKQLLMVGGVDKYYQVARCFRDEDLRADRQPEFTQVDMELSFVDQEDILQHLERLFKHIMREAKGIEIPGRFPRITWTEAMDRYGSDKPDLRFGLPIVDITEIAQNCGFTVFRKAVEAGGVVRAINVKGHGDFTRSEIEMLTNQAVSYGAKGMAWISVKEDGELYSVLTKYFQKEEMDAILEAVEAEPGDFILFGADKLSVVRKVLGALRLDIGDLLGLRSKEEYQFLIVTDFPQFEYSEEEHRYVATHHPFTMPYPEDLPYLCSDPGRVRAQAYDVVLNGVELGSGSIRIHQKEVQRKMFEALGFEGEEIEKRFGFMVKAFQYGTPPHGGFAFGLDRLVMLLVGADSLREIVAFPKIKDASCPMTDAPTEVDEEQLEALDICIGHQAGNRKKRTEKTSRDSSIDVDNVANLAKLNLAGDEKERMEVELGAVISFANQLAEIDTEGVAPMAHVVPMKNVFREDTVKPRQQRDPLLENAPTKSNGYIYVPKVIE